MPVSPLVGQRIHVVGPSSSGKSMLAERLAAMLDAPYIELDALFWLPGWTERETADFRAKVATAVAGEQWTVSGNYASRVRDLTWSRAETVVWLDLPLRTTIPRMLARSWRRWRTRELLWGTNVEWFWPQLQIWNPKRSLVGWALATHREHRRSILEAMADPRWGHLRFIRLRSPREVEHFLADVARSLDG